MLPSWFNSSWLEVSEDVEKSLEGLFVETDDDDDDHLEEEAAQTVPLTVILDDEVLAMAGVETMPLVLGTYHVEFTSQARVVSSTELLRLFSALSAQRGEIDIARVGLQSAKAEYDRLLKITDSVAKKNIAYAKADWLNKQIQYRAKQNAYESQLSELEQVWGGVLSEKLLNADDTFTALLAGDKALIEVAQPVELSTQPPVPQVELSLQQNRQARFDADYLSSLGSHTAFPQRTSHFYIADKVGLKGDMWLYAWLSLDDEEKAGFMLPESSIVWYAGTSWVYIEDEEGVYVRHPVKEAQVSSQGMFVTIGFEAGEALVTAGSQMLLSEEFRWQIHGEDDDD
jgi:hypothetical protein